YISFNQLLEVWQHKNEQRGLRINAIKEIDNVGSYVTKYISKEIEAIRAGKGGEREKEKKIFFQSRGLKKPKEEETTEEEIQKTELKKTKEQETTKEEI